MGLRFRKSITLIPGLVTLNISKTGISLSLGPKGKSINVSSNGDVHGNIGFGKGASYRKKLGNILPKGEGTKLYKKYLAYVVGAIVVLYLAYQFAAPVISKLFSATAN